SSGVVCGKVFPKKPSQIHHLYHPPSIQKFQWQDLKILNHAKSYPPYLEERSNTKIYPALPNEKRRRQI
ncbi:hypothetical protein A2U01_0053757, partial [Trifolium medium]|nr:hypothetical protein [Trifolium medium]